VENRKSALVIQALKFLGRKSVLSVRRTFWEKATILHQEHHRQEDKELPDRYSRHYYDLAMLAQSKYKSAALEYLELLARVVEHKKCFFPPRLKIVEFYTDGHECADYMERCGLPIHTADPKTARSPKPVDTCYVSGYNIII